MSPMRPPSRRTTKKGYTPQEVRSALSHCLFAWGFGSAFCAIAGGPAFINFLNKYLRTSDPVFGLITGLASIGVIFQLLGSYHVERSGRTKRSFLLYGTIHRLLWLGVAAIPLLFPVRPETTPTVQIALVLVITLLSAFVGNYAGAGWTAWMSDIVPSSLAGKFFGYRTRLGLASMVVTALISSFFITRHPTSGWIYASALGLAALLGAVDILMYSRVREIPRPVEEQPPTPVEIITTPWRNLLFRRYSLYTFVTWISYMMMAPFLWRFCTKPAAEHGLDLNLFQATLLLFLLPTVAMAWVSPFWGTAVDRLGSKTVLAASACWQVLPACCWLFMRPDWIWLIPVFVVVGGLTWPGIDQVSMYMQVREYPDHRRSAYTAMSAIVLGLALTAGPILGGACADFWQRHLPSLPLLPSWVSHYHLLFLTAIVLRVLTLLLLLPRIPLPVKAGPHAVVGAVLADLAQTIPGVAVWLRRRRRAAPPTTAMR